MMQIDRSDARVGAGKRGVAVVLDSWAVIRSLENAQPAAAAVAELLEADRPVMRWITLGEVFYVVPRGFGEEAAHSTVRDLRVEIAPELPNESRVLEAARIKAEYPTAYADAFAAATALARDATLWTGDSELLIEDAPWRWRDLR